MRLVKKTVVPQQNKTKWEAFNVSAVLVYNRVYTLTENIIVMPVPAEVMTPASVSRMVPLRCHLHPNAQRKRK